MVKLAEAAALRLQAQAKLVQAAQLRETPVPMKAVELAAPHKTLSSSNWGFQSSPASSETASRSDSVP